MTGNEFMRRLTNGHVDILRIMLQILAKTHTPFCVIGGLAVNAYATPVVSLDLDIAVVPGQIDPVCEAAESAGLRVERFEHSINLGSERSDLRVQLQTDSRYHDFIPRAVEREVLGYKMMVATAEDVLQGKLWAWKDKKRRPSKRQKDLADILRLAEAMPELANRLPDEVRAMLE